MADFKTSGTNLTAVADAIRLKGGTNLPLSFPDGFVTAIENIQTGGGSTLITKSITANGTYEAEDDNADGYSEVTVAVSSPLVAGTFTGQDAEKGSAKDISLPYTGSGYPIACIIFPTAGSYKSGTDYYTTIHKNAVDCIAFAKANTGIAPDYADSSEKNLASVFTIYKSKDTDATSYTTNGYADIRTFRNNAAAQTNVDIVRIRSNTTLSVYIANTSWGFMAGVEYTYIIVYSS